MQALSTASNFHVALLMLGTHGDMVIGIPVAQYLQKMGVQVTMIVPENFADVCRTHHVPYRVLPANTHELISKAGALLESSGSFLKLIKEGRGILSLELVENTIRSIEQSLIEIKPQLLISHDWARFFLFSAVAERLGIAHGSLSPNITADPRVPIASSILPPSANNWNPRLIRMTHGLLANLLSMVLGAPGRQALCRMEGKSFTILDVLRIPAWFRKYSEQEVISIYSMNPVFLQGRAVSDPRVVFPGYCKLGDDSADPDLIKKLKSDGPPWWAFSFGSLAANPLRMTNIILEAVKQKNIRALIIGGWGGLQAPSEDSIDTDRVVFTPYAPYGEISPFLEGFVIHGGSGAIHTTVPHGIPIAVVGFFPDQRWFASMVGKIGGIDIPFTPQQKFNAQWLADVIDWGQKPETRQAMQRIALAFRDNTPENPAQVAGDAIIRAINPDKAYA